MAKTRAQRRKRDEPEAASLPAAAADERPRASAKRARKSATAVAEDEPKPKSAREATKPADARDGTPMAGVKTFVAFLRGVNVSGARPMPMAKLRKLLDEVPGFSETSTLLQTGNIKLNAPGTATTATVTSTLAVLVVENFGYDVPIIVRTLDELRAVHDACPYKEAVAADYRKVHLALFSEAPDAALVAALQAEAPYPQDEELAFLPDCAFLHTPLGYGRAKVNNNFLEKRLGIEVTCRNMGTVQKLLV